MRFAPVSIQINSPPEAAADVAGVGPATLHRVAGGAAALSASWGLNPAPDPIPTEDDGDEE